MPIPTAVCMICNEVVNKRSTLSLETLGLGDGRACRSHEQVVRGLSVKAEMDRAHRRETQIVSNLNVMAGVASVRVMHSFFGWSVEFCLMRLRMRFSKDEMSRIERELSEKSAEMTRDEKLLTAVVAADVLVDQIREKHGLNPHPEV